MLTLGHFSIILSIMNLTDWQKLTKTTDQNLAEQLGIHPSLLSHFRSGNRKCGPELAEKIEKLTNRAVTKEELVWPHLY